MSLRVVLDDADTGEEIVTFYRRGRVYTYLRDAVTKRFIRRLYGIELRIYMEVEYDVTRARKGNPLYVDAVFIGALKPEMIFELREHEDDLIYRCENEVGKDFGWSVVDLLLSLRGIEYGSNIRPELREKEFIRVRGRLREVETAKTDMFYYEVVWKHRPEDRVRKKERWLTK
jgi:hypothetical protein